MPNSTEADYWNEQYLQQQTAWDIGYAVPAIAEYLKQISLHNLQVLVPGAGNAWEVEHIWRQKQHRVYMLDFAHEAIVRFRERVPDFPENQIFYTDFFQHTAQYDLVLEHTFMSSMPPGLWPQYAKHVAQLLHKNGKLVGVWFNTPFEHQGPPYAASAAEYHQIFSPYFHIRVSDENRFSIKPRRGREQFMILEKR